VSFRDDGPVQAGVLLGEEIVPLASLEQPATTMRGVLAALDRDGLAALASGPQTPGSVFA
jgi:hypothetical protein